MKGKIPWSYFKSYMICGQQAYLMDLNTEDLSNKFKTEGISFHKFTQEYMKLERPPQDKTFNKPELQAFHEFELRRYDWCRKENIPWKPFALEKEYATDEFMCIADRIDDNGDKTYTLVEYKRNPSTWDRKQLAFNKFVIEEASGIVINKFAIWYAQQPDENYYSTPHKGSLNSMKRKMSLVLPSQIWIFSSQARVRMFLLRL